MKKAPMLATPAGSMLPNEGDRKTSFKRFLYVLNQQKILYLMLLPGLLFYILFKLLPFFGLYIAFSDYSVVLPNIFAGKFVGLKYFKIIFSGGNFWQLFGNTLALSLMNIIFYFPLPIILALLLNEVRVVAFKKFVQTVTYIPHFFSWVVIGGISYSLLTTNNGPINNILEMLFGTKIDFLSTTEWFRPLILSQQIWKDVGWGTIIYLAAITSIDTAMYEAASLDGATRLQMITRITLPSIMPTIATLLILRMGSFMDTSFDQIFLMLNYGNMSVGQVFDTYIYELGVNQGQYSYSTAIGLFKSIISLLMVLGTNKLAKILGNEGIV